MARHVIALLALLLVALALGGVWASGGGPVAAVPLTLTPLEDAHVDASRPAKNYGNSTSFRTDASPIKKAYIKFDVPAGADVSSAELRVFAQTNNALGVEVHVSDNGWSESTLIYTNAPDVGLLIDTSGPITGGNWYSFDVSGFVPADAQVTFAVTSQSTTATKFSSSEGANPPQLLVPAPQPTATFTPGPSATPTETPTPAPSSTPTETPTAGPSPTPSSTPTPTSTPTASPLPAFLVSRQGDTSTYTAESGSTVYTGALKFVVESAVNDLRSAGGGTITFTAGTFDLGTSYFKVNSVQNVIFQGQGIDVTIIQNSTTAAADTEVFNTNQLDQSVIRDMTISAGGSARNTSDAIDFDGGDNNLVERVKIIAARGRGIIFDGKDIANGVPNTADRNTVRDCIITGAITSDGIELLASSNNLVENCTITGVGGHGIQITKSSTSADQPNKQSTNNIVRRNTIGIQGSDKRGIDLKSGNGNVLIDNNVSSKGDGVRIYSGDSIVCDGNVVDANTVSSSAGYGLYIVSTLCHDTVVCSNNSFTGALGAIRNLGTNTHFVTC